MLHSGFVFGQFHFDAQRLLLLRDGEPVPLGRRGALLLALLLARHGSVVSKADLLDAAWPEETVEESNLSVQIAKLRRLIGGRIRTVERVGYQFLPDLPVARTPPPLPDFPTLAIFPLEGRGSSLMDELTVALTQFRTLRISDPDSSPRHARYSLSSGTISPDGRTLARLTDTAHGITIWAQQFDSAAAGLSGAIAAAVESQINAAEVARAHLGREPMAEAYVNYLRGRFILQSSRQDDNAVAYRHFQRAVELEPENVVYLAGASEALHHRLSVGWQPFDADHKRYSAELVTRAFDRAGNDAVSLALLAAAMFTVDEEELGLATARRAVIMNPHSVLVLACAGLANVWGGDIDEAEALYRNALHLAPGDPGHRFILAGLAQVARLRGDHSLTLAVAQQAHALSPGYSGPHWSMIVANVGLGRMSEARQCLRRYQAISPGVTIRSVAAGQHYGDRARLKPVLDGLRRAGLPER